MSFADVPPVLNVLPPGHPGGIDEPISAGAVLSGSGQRAGGGSLDPAIHSKPIHRPSADTSGVEIGALGPKVLVAVEDTDESVNALRTAHRLFGDAAHYFVINVGNHAYPTMEWAYAYPVAAPMAWYPPTSVEDPATNSTSIAVAEETANDVAARAGLDDVISVGDLGDPATAIISAAEANQVDVVVIGSHERGWFSRLFTGSVEGDLLRSAPFSVLVVR